MFKKFALVYYVLVYLSLLRLNVTASISSPSPDTFNHRYDTINGIRYHYVDEGPKDGPVVVLLHGFPDLWYGWRHQIKFLANRGYRVICPDLRGYGETDSPHCPPNDIRMYSTKNVSNDIIEILDKNDIGKFVVIGHDWGGHLAWRSYLHHPSRLLGVGSFSTPYRLPGKKFVPLEESIKSEPNFAYQLVFRKPETDKYFDDNVGLVLRSIYQFNRPQDDSVGFLKRVHLLAPDAPNTPLEPVKFLTDQEIQYYIDEYTKRGFHGGLNWYRTTRVNWENERDLPLTINVPSMMVTAGHDQVLPSNLDHTMSKYIPNLTRKHIENSGHWILAEQSDLSNQYIVEFLGNLTLKPINK